MALKLEQNVDLTKFNSFGVTCHAEWFVAVASVDQLLEASEFAKAKRLPLTILGGGSNVVLPLRLPGLCLHMDMHGVEFVGSGVWAAAGESWHGLVKKSLQQELSGIENLGLIPGQVGAAPIQNIGAYGVELADCLVAVEGLELSSGMPFRLSRAECELGYRTSLFKREAGSGLVVTAIELALNQDFKPQLEYQGLRQTLGDTEPTAVRVFEAVCRLRESKLPDPAIRGNAGSFFKNPVVSEQHYRALSSEFHQLLGRSQAEGYKLAAAQLIELAGLKGEQVGGAKVSEQHALVLENAGGATGEDVIALARKVQEKIAARFDLVLEIEPVSYVT